MQVNMFRGLHIFNQSAVYVPYPIKVVLFLLFKGNFLRFDNHSIQKGFDYNYILLASAI